MSELFNVLLSLSFSGSVVALTFFIIRMFTRGRLPKSWQYYIWLIILLRLILPITFKLNVIDNLFQNPGEFTPIYNIHLLLRTNIGVEVDLSKSLWILWSCGFIFMIIKRLYQLYHFNKIVKSTSELITNTEILDIVHSCLKETNIKRNVEVYKSTIVTTPMLIGIFTPMILLPLRLSCKKELRFVFTHELIHYKRKDLWYKWFVQFLLCVHWFNPFIHLIAYRIDRDCELACDEAVIKSLEIQEKKEYGKTIIDIAELSRGPVGILAATMCDEKKIIKERLHAIKRHKKDNKLITLLSIFLLIAFSGLSAIMGALII